MLKLAREYNVRVSALNPSKEAREDLPIWYHIQSDPSARRLYKTKTAKCLRKRHKVILVRDALKVLVTLGGDHEYQNNCLCDPCKMIRTQSGCPHPHDCITLAATLVSKILPRWSPQSRTDQGAVTNASTIELEEGEEVIARGTPEENLRDTITIFSGTTRPEIEDAASLPTDGEATPRTTVIYTDGACTNNGMESAKAGSGIWYGDDDPRNKSIRVPLKKQTNQTAELMAILTAVRDNPPGDNLRIVSDSRYAINGLTKYATKWEARNWVGNQHGDLFRCITAWTRWRQGITTLKWTKGHNGTKGNEEADKLAKEGTAKPLASSPDALRAPAKDLTAQGANLAKLEQKDFYRIIRDKNRIPARTRTERMVGRIQACAEDMFGQPPGAEAVWSATKHRDFTRKTRDFLWKSTQHAYKVGEYWTHINGYEGRGICPLCDDQEDMEHILMKCKSKARSTAWRLANDLWAKTDDTKLPANIGDVLGCGLAAFTTDGKPNDGKSRLYRIIVSETAYLIWKIRNERRIRDDDGEERHNTEEEATTRWRKALNRRLTNDRFLTDTTRFRKRALNAELVKRTWTGCLENEEALPQEWYKTRGGFSGYVAGGSPRIRQVGPSPTQARSPTQSRAAASA